VRRLQIGGLLLLVLAACQSGETPSTVPTADAARDTATVSRDEAFVIATWNVYGYPETAADLRTWFSERLAELDPDVLCIQEIANQDRVNAFLETEPGFVAAAFKDSRDGQDNAIFIKRGATVVDLPDPEGFQHPAQAAYVCAGGLDLVIVTVHLSWSDKERRAAEKQLLGTVVAEYLAFDPDVMVAGDFNTTENAIEELALATGTMVMVPEGQDGVGTTDGGNRYDHFLISPDLAQEEAICSRIETFEGQDRSIVFRVSDHLPVVAEFRTSDKFRDRH
jgi:endonuclease/exonuclease/phosphatase family metal-dependent hydrolase